MKTMNHSRAAISTAFALLCLLVLFNVSVVMGQTAGKDGNLNLNATSVVNTYTRLTANASVGNTSLTVQSNTGITAGDLVMIYQAQGAVINTASNQGNTYGEITDYANAGHYELRGVLSVAGTTTINLTAAVQNNYSVSGNTQVVRVPQYNNATIRSAGTLRATAWDGQVGGIVALRVTNTLTVTGQINVSGQGFRGGTLTVGNSATTDFTVFRSTSANDGAMKGESIAGLATSLTNGGYSRGAAANGGGGGNTHNGGGGGGANGNNGNTWNGAGVMCSSCTGTAAWALDSAYILNGNSLTTSSGGGRGGYTYSHTDMNALTLGPGDATWTGNYRRQRGGMGGRPLQSFPCFRVFMGGGGGAGNANNNSGGAGGNGGGIVLIIANSVATGGTGSINANGNNGGTTTNTYNDAPGGGGGGGTILIYATAITGVTLNANGGNGGNQLITNAEAEGPGGGGGGGFIATSFTGVTRNANGGTGGTTTSTALTEWPTNGATDGASGEIRTDMCNVPLPVELTMFAAKKSAAGVLLRWSTATENNNFGFEVERSVDGGEWEYLGFVEGAGNTSAPRDYSFNDKQVFSISANTKAEYRLRQIDRDGQFEYSPSVNVNLSEAPVLMELQAYPNPTQAFSSIRFTLSEEQHVALSVFNALGQQVVSLANNEVYPAGSYALPLDASSFLPGAYLVRLATESGSLTRRIVVTR